MAEIIFYFNFTIIPKENNGKNNFKLKNRRVYFYGFKKVVDI